MTGVLVRTGVVTVCCGGHRPTPGEASVCMCCAQCITNTAVQQRPAHLRVAEARADREVTAFWLHAVRGTVRHLNVLLLREALDMVIRPLEVAYLHAVALPPEAERPDTPELDALWLRSQLSPWFTHHADPLVAS